MLCHVNAPPLPKVSACFPYAKHKPAHHGHSTPDADGQEWFDEDFGLSKTRREAEQLRLQQLQIEQEIEQLQAQQDQVPYYYLREIPNKPPPPYTPPGQAPTKEKTSPVPTSQEQVKRNIKLFARTIYKAVQSGCSPVCEARDSYTKFLWDLAHELVVEVTENRLQEPEHQLPWERVSPPLSVARSALRPRSEESVVDAVLQKALVFLGHKPRVAQETLIVQWSQKRRDHVDKLLIWESQAEEEEWTRFDEQVVSVKRELVNSLMDSLLDETAAVFTALLNKKKKT